MSQAVVEETLKDATTYPKFCPSCGKRRQELSNGLIPTCLFCGFAWDRVSNSEYTIKDSLLNLTDGELVNIVRQILEAKRGVIPVVSKRINKDESYLRRILDGHRNVPDILKPLMEEFRLRLRGDLGDEGNLQGGEEKLA